jgi:SulP family sulfate permease
LFFASTNDLVSQFDYSGDPEHVIIDMSKAQIYDTTTVAAIDSVVYRYARRNKTVELVGLNQASQRWQDLSGSFSAEH